MVQGGKKISNSRLDKLKKSSQSAKVTKKIKKQHQTKIGNPVQIPNMKNRFRDEAITERLLSKAIDKSNEQKMAAKALQSGVRVGMADLLSKGKELNRETRRKQLKNKVGRVEEKLKELEKKAEVEGLL
jgi:hypothetical protein